MVVYFQSESVETTVGLQEWTQTWAEANLKELKEVGGSFLEREVRLAKHIMQVATMVTTGVFGRWRTRTGNRCGVSLGCGTTSR